MRMLRRNVGLLLVILHVLLDAHELVYELLLSYWLLVLVLMVVAVMVLLMMSVVHGSRSGGRRRCRRLMVVVMVQVARRLVIGHGSHRLLFGRNRRSIGVAVGQLGCIELHVYAANYGFLVGLSIVSSSARLYAIVRV